MNALRQALGDYLVVRRALGFKLAGDDTVLNSFVDYLEGRGLATITTEAAIAWACLPVDATPGHWAGRLSTARGFATWMSSLDPVTQIPPLRMFPARRRAEPVVCTPAQVAAIVEAARPAVASLPAATYHAVIGLIAVTGMRLGEACGLDDTDFDRAEGLVTIRAAKFGKSRQLPLHPGAVDALVVYTDVRDTLFPQRSTPALFVSGVGRRVTTNKVEEAWHGVVERAGARRAHDGRAPRVHDLRHSFAVNTLRRWHAERLDVEARLPLLSTYLGHVNPAATYWYLTATPDLLAAAADRLEQNTGGRR